MKEQALDNRVRPAVEFAPGVTALVSAVLLLLQPAWFLPLLPGAASVAGVCCLLLGGWRIVQGIRILRYRRHLLHLSPHELRAGRIPLRPDSLYLGMGFRWTRAHSQRLIERRAPGAGRWLRPGLVERLCRGEDALQMGGEPALHGVGAQEEEAVFLREADRSGHALVMGTTRVGKTRLAELLITQDIHRGHCVIVFDPKGDVALRQRVCTEAARARRTQQLHLFHLGFPELSEGYNPVGEFHRVTEVASRIAAQLPGEGDGAAFREFTWRFVNIIAQALAKLGRKPDVRALRRFLSHIEPLLIQYCEHWLGHSGPTDWRLQVAQIQKELRPGSLPPALRGRQPRAVALFHFMRRHSVQDDVMEGLFSILTCEKSHFDKLIASSLPLLEKLGTGKVGELLVCQGDRPMLDWRRLVREGGIAYVGLDALADAEVAAAVGGSMFADLSSVAGQLYKHGTHYGLPSGAVQTGSICIHADEFSEIVGKEFIPLLNKAGGAGVKVTAYTQTLSDIEAGTGDRASAGQVLGNLNTLIMLRVRNEETARLLTDQLPLVQLYTRVMESRFVDNDDPDTAVDFSSSNADRLNVAENPMLSPADLISLPKGQAFALLEGGHLVKLRLPLLTGDDGPQEIQSELPDG